MSGAMDEFIAAELARIAAVLAGQPPRIDDSTFPECERQQVDSILILLSSLNSLIEAFRSDLELFDYAEQNPAVRMAWSSIASRDAAVTLWNFGDALKFIQSALKKCPSLKTQRKEVALKAAIGRFGAAFPFAKKVRDATAHQVGQIATPKDRKLNSLRGVRVLLINCRIGRKVMYSKEGREVSFEISGGTILTLETVRDTVFKVFREARNPGSGDALPNPQL